MTGVNQEEPGMMKDIIVNYTALNDKIDVNKQTYFRFSIKGKD